MFAVLESQCFKPYIYPFSKSEIKLDMAWPREVYWRRSNCEMLSVQVKGDNDKSNAKRGLHFISNANLHDGQYEFRNCLNWFPGNIEETKQIYKSYFPKTRMRYRFGSLLIHMHDPKFEMFAKFLPHQGHLIFLVQLIKLNNIN